MLVFIYLFNQDRRKESWRVKGLWSKVHLENCGRVSVLGQSVVQV